MPGFCQIIVYDTALYFSKLLERKGGVPAQYPVTRQKIKALPGKRGQGNKETFPPHNLEAMRIYLIRNTFQKLRGGKNNEKESISINLALVLAFASSALAEVKFGGNFTFTLEQDHFQFFKEGKGFDLKGSRTFNITLSGKNVREADEDVEEHVNWTFSAALDKDFALSTYQLSLFDQYFTAHLWKGAGRGSKRPPPRLRLLRQPLAVTLTVHA